MGGGVAGETVAPPLSFVRCERLEPWGMGWGNRGAGANRGERMDVTGAIANPKNALIGGFGGWVDMWDDRAVSAQTVRQVVQPCGR